MYHNWYSQPIMYRNSKQSRSIVNSYIDINEINIHLLSQTIQNTDNMALEVQFLAQQCGRI